MNRWPDLFEPFTKWRMSKLGRASAGALSAYAVAGLEPELVLDFATDTYRVDGSASTFSSAVTFARASTATYVDSSGTLQTASSGVARVGNHVYNGTSWVNRGLLLESEARTNLVTYSNDFTDASWSATTANVTRTANQGVSPDGNANADRVVSTSTTWAFRDSQTLTAAPYTFSVWVKSNTGSNQNFGLYFAGTSNPVGDYVATSEWQRFVLTGTIVTTSSGVGFYNGTSAQIVDLLVYGAQLEAGSTPSSYIPTNGSTATRAAETATVAAANMPWPTPNVIGSELVTNGTFDTDVSGWTDVSSAGGAISWNVAGYLELVYTTGSAIARQAVTTVAGKVYTFQVEHVASTAGTAQVFVGSTAGASDLLALQTIDAGSTGVFFFVASGTAAHLTVRNVNAGTCTIDNISVREIDPLAVSIQMDGDVTYADNGARDEVGFYDWDTSPDLIRLWLHTDGANTGRLEFQQYYNNSVYDTVLSSTTAFAPGVGVPFNIAARHGTTFLNGAIGGVALTANTTPVGLPDSSSTDFTIGRDFMGNIGQVRVWAADLGDDGIEEATTS